MKPSEEINERCRGRWKDVLSRLGLRADLLNNAHGPCPGCGGKDRFRFDDRDGEGTFICSQGGGGNLAGNGIDLVAHAKSISWVEAMRMVAREIGLDLGSGRVDEDRPTAPVQPKPAPAPLPKPEYKAELLERFAGNMAKEVDLVWLANRSACDPALVDHERFLRLLYNEGEHVLVFTDDRSQGDAVWPGDLIPQEGPRGVWYLAQPVDGKSYPNPRREGRLSRRAEESVMSWRYMVLESDEAPLRLWLGALARLPLRISAIYTSGGRSVHALVRVDCPTKPAWDQEKRDMKPGLVMLGADPGAMSAVRLTRLPGCWRREKRAMQKLLYIQPDPKLRALVECPVTRDVEADWLRWAEVGTADADETGGGWIEKGLEFYATVSSRCRAALTQWREKEKGKENDQRNQAAVAQGCDPDGDGRGSPDRGGSG